MRGISRLAECVLAFQEGLDYIELVIMNSSHCLNSCNTE